MGLVEYLASTFGVGVAIAVSIFLGCVWAERDKSIRREALDDIARVLKDPSWLHSDQAVTIIRRLFHWTFGERSWSLRCVKASFIVTLLTDLVLFLSLPGPFQHALRMIRLYLQGPRDVWNIVIDIFAQGFIGILLSSFLADYLSLLKTRLILCHWGDAPMLRMSLIVVGDLIASVAISLAIQAAMSVFATEMLWRQYGYEFVCAHYGLCSLVDTEADIIAQQFQRLFTSGEAVPYTVFLLSTAFTTVWTILMLVAILLLKMVARLRFAATWLYDADTHPLRAIGLAAASFVLVVTLVCWLLRSIV